MKSDEEKLSFVIRFTEMDLKSLRRGDFLNLQDDLLDFLGRTDEALRNNLTPPSLELLRKDAERILRQHVEISRPKEPPMKVNAEENDIPLTLKGFQWEDA